MSTFLRQIELEFPNIYHVKKRLNEDFFKNGRIQGAVSVVYYPVQYGPMSHSELEVEGSCYHFRSLIGPCHEIPKIRSLYKRIYHVRRLPSDRQSLPFVCFYITTTPRQLSNINNDVDHLRSMRGLTCIHAVNRALAKYTDYYIPFPISLCPTSNALSLGISKTILGSNRITKIEPHVFHRSAGLLVADTIIAVIPEAVAIFVLVHTLAIMSFNAMIIISTYGYQNDPA